MSDFFIRRLREVALIAYLFVLIQSLPTGSLNKPSPGLFYYWSGLWQNWNMFAPEPAFESHQVSAIFTLPDGRESIFYFPNHKHPYHYPGPILEKFRKWQSESLPLPEYKYLVPRAIEFAKNSTHIEKYTRLRLIHSVQDMSSTNKPTEEVLHDSQK